MEEWKTYKIGEVLQLKYGKDHKGLKDGSIPLYGSGGIMRYVERSLYNGPTIMIPRKGSLNNIMYSNGPIWAVDTMFWSIINTELVNPLFLYYAIRKKDFASLNVGSAVPSLTVPVIEGIDIQIPSLTTQQNIIDILSSLDEKIELNKRINDNLEQQAQALFKSWFVDFKPFRQGKFIESELGMIPEGWTVSTLDSICDIIGGGTPSKAHTEYYCKDGIAWITPKDLSNSHAKYTSHGEIDITEIGYTNSSAKLMPRGTVLFSSRAPIGYLSIASNELCTNQGFKSLVPQIAGTCYLYLYLSTYSDIIEAQATGSTFKEASGALIKSQPVIIPQDKTILDKFESEVSPIFNYQEVLEKETQQLIVIRDTLLPKLMSGELKINGINC